VPDPNGTGVQGIFVVDGTHLHDTGVVGGECAEWSPDSSRLAYCHHPGDGDFDVWAMNADGSDQRQLTHTADGEGPVAWLPDGRIVYSSFHSCGVRATRSTGWSPFDEVMVARYLFGLKPVRGTIDP
jgi:hypothetical protein